RAAATPAPDGSAGTRAPGTAPPSDRSRGFWLRTLPDPLLAALVHLFLPERDGLLERVDRLPARGERVRAVRGGDGDHDRELADVDASDPVGDRDLAEVVRPLQLLRELGHHLLGHPAVRLVVEVVDGAPARLDPRRPDEGRDPAGARIRDLPDHRPRVDRLLGEAEGAAGDGRDQRHLVAVGERGLAVGVALVDRVEQARRLVSEPELRPDLGDARGLELALGPPGALA